MISRILSTMLFILTLCMANLGFADQKDEVIKALNKNLPKMYNENVEITSIGLEGNNMIFNYRLVKVLENEVNQDKIDELKSELQETACTAPESMEMLKNGIIINYVFNDKNNKLIAKKIVTLNDCKKDKPTDQ